MKVVRICLLAAATGVWVGSHAEFVNPNDDPKPENPPARALKPLKVFILAGQSNMQGHAHVSTFDSLADDPKTAPLLNEMRTPDGKPRVCERVWISSVGCLGDAYSDLREQAGKLTVRFGAFGPSGERIGPEFMFGLTMEKNLNEPILIIKTSWGGRSLHTDFRPPSTGRKRSTTSPGSSGSGGASTPRRRPKRSARTVACTTGT